MRIDLPDTRRQMPRWPSALWLFVGLEVLLLLAVRSMVLAFDEVPHRTVAWRWELLGIANGKTGLIQWVLAVDLLLVLAFWCAFRSARGARGPLATATRTASLAGAVVVLALAWAWMQLAEAGPPLRVVAIFERGPDGIYVRRSASSGRSAGVAIEKRSEEQLP